MEQIKLGAIRLLPYLLGLVVLVGQSCVLRDDQTNGPAASSAAADRYETIGDLIAIVTAGDGRVPVLKWIDWQKPHGEAYSFAYEYPLKYGLGQAYYWGDWDMRIEDYCAVRMQPDYTPVQVDFTLGWYAAVSGRTVSQLRAEYMEQYQQYGGSVEENVGASGNVVGDTYTISTEEFTAKLFERDELGEDRTIFAMMLPVSQVEYVVERNLRFPDLLQFGTEDRPATFTELAGLLREQGARGVLDQFDFSQFTQSTWQAPLVEEEPRGYNHSVMYTYGILQWNARTACYLAAFDDGAFAQLVFTPEWYAAHAGHTASELDSEFDALFAANQGRTLTLDSLNDNFDLEFSYLVLDGVNLVRRRYTAEQAEGGTYYFLLTGEQLFVDAAAEFPSWNAQMLPDKLGTGALEDLVRETVEQPGNQLVARYVVGALRQEYPVGIHHTSPFTTRQHYVVNETGALRSMCVADLLDETYLDFLEVRPVWFAEILGVSSEDLAAEFTELQAQLGSLEATGDAFEQPGDGFRYGPVVVTRIAPEHAADGAEWIHIELPDWP
ncbi:hypothetical protein JW859_01970 [bacterium]|nr:hypothetical protein [bacterium]